MFGRPGFKSILRALAGQWEENEEILAEAGDKMIDALERSIKGKVSDGQDVEMPPAQECVKKCFTQFLKR